MIWSIVERTNFFHSFMTVLQNGHNFANFFDNLGIDLARHEFFHGGQIFFAARHDCWQFLVQFGIQLEK